MCFLPTGSGVGSRGIEKALYRRPFRSATSEKAVGASQRHYPAAYYARRAPGLVHTCCVLRLRRRLRLVEGIRVVAVRAKHYRAAPRGGPEPGGGLLAGLPYAVRPLYFAIAITCRRFPAIVAVLCQARWQCLQRFHLCGQFPRKLFYLECHCTEQVPNRGLVFLKGIWRS